MVAASVSVCITKYSIFPANISLNARLNRLPFLFRFEIKMWSNLRVPGRTPEHTGAKGGEKHNAPVRQSWTITPSTPGRYYFHGRL